jgi:hypothetical protein
MVAQARPASFSDGSGGGGGGRGGDQPVLCCPSLCLLALLSFLLVRGKGDAVAAREVVYDRWGQMGLPVGPGMRDANLAVRCGAVLVTFLVRCREQTAIAGYLSTRQYRTVVYFFTKYT